MAKKRAERRSKQPAKANKAQRAPSQWSKVPKKYILVAVGVSLTILVVVILAVTLSPSGTTGSFSSSEKDQIVQLHNEARRAVPSASNMIALTWDEDLAASAAEHVAKCKWGHASDLYSSEDMSEWQGESLGAWYDSSPSEHITVALDRTQGWIDELQYYDLTTGACSGVCGHYTQVIWADTSRVGCALAECTGMADYPYQYYFACRYQTPGNWGGETPFSNGDSCSSCPEGFGGCDDGLCA